MRRRRWPPGKRSAAKNPERNEIDWSSFHQQICATRSVQLLLTEASRVCQPKIGGVLSLSSLWSSSSPAQSIWGLFDYEDDAEAGESRYGCQRARQKRIAEPGGSALVRLRVLLLSVLVEEVVHPLRSVEVWI